MLLGAPPATYLAEVRLHRAAELLRATTEPIGAVARGKIQATVDNARMMLSVSPSLAALAKSYEVSHERAPRSVADLPKSTPQAEALAKQLKAEGYRFVGPTSVYAFMQNTGAVNDHVQGCFRA